MEHSMEPMALVSWLRARAKGCRTEAGFLDAAADRLVMLADRVVSVPTVQREVADVPSTLTSTPPAEPPVVFSHNGPPLPPEPPRDLVPCPRTPAQVDTPETKPMTAAEVCKRLGCSGTFLSQLREHGIVAVAGTNGAMGRTLFDRASVEAARGTWTARLAMAKASVQPATKQAPPVMSLGFLTAAEVAADLGCSRAYVTLMLQHGVIRGTKQSTAQGVHYWRIDEASVDAVRRDDAWRGLLSAALAKAKAERIARLNGESQGVQVAEEAPVDDVATEPVAEPVVASLPPVDEPDHDSTESAVAETPDPVVETVAPVAVNPATESKPKRTVHRQKATNERDAGDPFPDGATVTPLALVMRWGLTMRQLRAIVGEGWLRANADGDVLEADAQWFEKGTGPGSLRQWKRDNIGKGYGTACASSLGQQEHG